MKTMKDAELKKVNGGTDLGASKSKFNEGDHVTSLSHPEYSVGVIAEKYYDGVWMYKVGFIASGMADCPEDDLKKTMF